MVLICLVLRSRRSLAVVAGMKKPIDHAEPTKVERLKNKNKKQLNCVKFRCKFSISLWKMLPLWYKFFVHIGNLKGRKRQAIMWNCCASRRAEKGTYAKCYNVSKLISIVEILLFLSDIKYSDSVVKL